MDPIRNDLHIEVIEVYGTNSSPLCLEFVEQINDALQRVKTRLIGWLVDSPSVQ